MEKGTETQAPEQTQATETQVTEPEQTQAHEKPAEHPRTFTQAEVNSLLRQERLEAEKKADTKYKELEQSVATEKQAREALEQEVKRSRMLQSISEKTGVPVSLLHGETEEEVQTNADAIKAFAKQSTVPTDKGAGAITRASKEEIANIKNDRQRLAAIANNLDMYRK